VSAVPLFGTVLVANRGEIACRVIRTLRDLGIRSVAVYSDADAGARHVGMADVAVRIGPAPAVESYLSIEAVLAAAAEVGADAIHPGYGFLSENTAFARACAEAGIVFIGPGVDAIEAMGDKIAAKALVAARGVPVVPGSSGAGLSDADLAEAAESVGYPLLLKPSAGGGGKGMQVVRSAAELPAALASARRIAAASFGDDTLLLERLIETPRHIEVQVLADRHGAVVHLGERECSLQRRHQKVVEEAPSPLLDDETRTRIGEAACEVARSVAYEGAGTVEFLVSDADPGTFFFIEMNTRLQVEHPVTELVTGLDLVELQLRIAAGDALPFAQDDVRITGHAIEARVYAESPARGFLPATGTVLEVVEPSGDGLRIDSSLVAGLTVSGDYDPMLAKAIAHGAYRVEALRRLDTLLRGYAILGVDTNVGFLRDLLAAPEVQAGRLDTGLIDRLGAPVDPEPTQADLRTAAAVVAGDPGDGPWRLDGWRVGGATRPALRRPGPGILTAVEIPPDGPVVWLHRDGRILAVPTPDRATRLAHRLAARERAAGPVAPELRASMPGTVVAVAVDDGATVDAGATLVTIEAMKMEHALTAPHAGTVSLRVHPGELVRRDQVVAVVTPHLDPEHTGDTA
jgi:acetyl-CoA/propionyl-CoA carboxylase biotin carboxyl carrier protein